MLESRHSSLNGGCRRRSCPTSMTFREDGFAIIERVCSQPECDNLIARLDSLGHRSAGSRCLLDLVWCRDVGILLRTRLAKELDFFADSVVVQCTYFHKSPEKNWFVAWHQDRSIPVKSVVESSMLTGWSNKEGMTFVHAPNEVLREMLAVRLHLDDSTMENGPLRIIPRSHLEGVLTPDQIERVRERHKELTCPVRKGGVFVMRPLLLHASSKTISSDSRRVLHLLLGPRRLPCGLAWRRWV